MARMGNEPTTVRAAARFLSTVKAVGLLAAILSGTVAQSSGQTFGAVPPAVNRIPAVNGVAPAAVAPERPATLATPPAVGPDGGSASQELVAEVRIVGNRTLPVDKILPHVRTRAGRPYDVEMIEEDVRRMIRTGQFLNVKPYSQKVAGGRVVIFEVVERPVIEAVLYVGNQKVSKSKLEKEVSLKVGDAIDPFAIEEARRKIQEYYQRNGFGKARVSIFEGDKPGDRRVVFLINEGPKQKIWWTSFVGNTIASDARLRTQIKSKPPILYLFKGEVNRQEIDEDVQRLTAYYRSLGFFRARVGRELEFDEDNDWLTLTFVIDEGPRYKVRNVSFIGNTKFDSRTLFEDVKLKGNQFFNQTMMTADVAAIQERYGGVGYIFADVKAEPRFLEDKPELDLVYNIQEGDRYRVGRINVEIKGEFPHTRVSTVLNRISLKPGDIVDIRELRKSEARLRSSGLFLVDPATGTMPKIVFSPPEVDEEESVAGRGPHRVNFRGQSPDPPGEPLRPVGSPAPPATAPRGVDLTLRAVASPRAADPAWAPEDETGRDSFEVPGSSRSPGEPVAAPGAAAERTGAPTHRATPPAPEGRTTFWGPRRADCSPETSRARPLAAAAPRGEPATPPSRYDSAARLAGFAGSASTAGAVAAARPAMIVRGQDGYDPNAGRSLPRLSYPWPSAAPPSATPTPPAAAGAPGGTSFGFGSPAVSGVPAGPTTAPVHPSYAMPQPIPGPLADDGDPGDAMAPGRQSAGDPVFPTPGPLWTDPAYAEPTRDIDLFPKLVETQTGRLMFGVGINSDAGLVGSFVLDEQNFDWRRWPRGWEDIRNATAWRGGGQRLRIEAVPGTQVQRYMINFQEPYLLNTDVSLGLSGFYYDRRYYEWDENRLGGRVALGYHFTPYLSGTLSFRGERVNVYNPITPPGVLPELDEVLAANGLYGFGVQLAHDTRDSAFLATEGHLVEISFEQVIGSFEYPRGELELRQYFLLHQRPDGSGRHVVSLSGRLGVTGSDTPIYDHYYAGGFSTIRGFDYRGVSPMRGVYRVGGHFMMLASVEYMFPITPDDVLRAVVFCDTGTVEKSIDQWEDNYRVAPGFGLRIMIPAMGPAPIALDFAFPISKNPGDHEEVFSFFLGVLR